MVESSSVAAPNAPSNIQSFIDPNGFMSTTWDETGGGVVQYNMQYRVQNSDDANDITIPTGMTNSNVSNLAIMVLYEVSMYVHMYIHPTVKVISNVEYAQLQLHYCSPFVVYQLKTRHKVTDRYHCKTLSSS